MRGWNLRILAIDLYWAEDSGNSTSLTTTTRPMIDQPQLPSRSCRWLRIQNRPEPITASGAKRL
ncbi:hypothetical protein QE386_002762 [Pseudoxanthomonas winnipegensis]|nr:hypothetical protein [Pseudoxanthomonas winnipegensis]